MSKLILIAGFGSIGRRHFRNLRALGFTDFIFYRSGKSSLDHGEILAYPVYGDLQEALAQRPDFTVVANPTSMHLPVAIAAANAQSHLLIEKPLSHSLEGYEALVTAAGRSQITATVGCQWRYHPLLISLRRQLLDGRLGAVLGARAEYGDYLPSWHPWEDHRSSYSAIESLGGGVILTLIHPLDYLYWLFGPVGDVHASMRRAPFLNTATPDDIAEITLEFENGVIAHVHLDYIQRPATHSMDVWGDHGRAHLDFARGVLRWDNADASAGLETVSDGFERNQMFLDEMRDFVLASAEHRPGPIPLEDGRAVLEIALRAKDDATARQR